MKKTIIAAFLGLISLGLAAQSERTLLNNARVRGAFVSPIFTTGKADGHQGYGAGGGFGLVINQFFIGGFGQAEIFDFKYGSGADQALGLGYGGLWMGYNVPTRRTLHLYTSLKIAGGATGLGRWSHPHYDWDFDIDFDDDSFNDAVLVIAPEAGVELNITHWMRLAGTVGYRYVDGFQGLDGVDKDVFNAPYYGLTLRVGWFGHRRGWHRTEEN